MSALSWQQWTLLAVYAFSALVTVGNIGAPRKPITPREAVILLLVSAAMVTLVVTA